MRTRLLSSLLFIAIAGGCAATGSGSAHYSASVTTPRLLFVTTDVQVIENHHEPIFFSSNYYWRYDNGVWYRSTYHTRGWVRVSVVPMQIRRIERPTAYVYYRGKANARAAVVQPTPAAAPVIRDHRDEKREMQEDRREIKQELKEERKQDQQQAKEERREVKEERKQDRKEERKEDRKDAKDAKDHAKGHGNDHGKSHKK